VVGVGVGAGLGSLLTTPPLLALLSPSLLPPPPQAHKVEHIEAITNHFAPIDTIANHLNKAEAVFSRINLIFIATLLILFI
jgi:hypothetical protein